MPGASPIGSFVPIVIDKVWPAPSGLLISFSIVTPWAISALNCSSVISDFPILTEISSTAGASKRPGTSSVNRTKLIGDEPSFLIVTDAVSSCLRYEGSTVLLYFFSTLASNTSNVDVSNLREPSVEWLALGNTVYPKSHVKSGLPVLSTVTESDSQRPSGRTSSETSAMSNNKSSLPFILTCNLTKSTVNDERFSKIVLHSQLSGLSDSTELM